ncbi:MAG: TonB-dependent receptor [Rhodospirillales bacterium]|nr:TonB-dependent receptor [Rhodospirillales bacterium]
MERVPSKPAGLARRAAVALALCAPVPALAQAPVQPAAPPSDETTLLPPVVVLAPTPLLGTGINRDQAPAQNQVFTGNDLRIQGPASALQTLQNQAQGVQLDNAAGSPFQPQVSYHGFVASPIQGTEQGLAVYVNGTRFNDPFGDTVNWDLIPDIAIDRMDLQGANPVFGLNALGGALAVRMKNGFTYHGGELDVSGGSFGRVSGAVEYGKRSGSTAVYAAAAGLHENGWRDAQSSGLKQFYGDVGWRGTTAEVHLNIDLAQTTLNGPGTTPVQLLAADAAAQLTGPNVIDNDYGRVILSGTDQVTDTTSLQGVVYYENLVQRLANGNGSALASCGPASPYQCESSGAVAIDANGTPIPAFLGPNGAYGSLVVQRTNTNGYGVSLQVTNQSAVLGRANQLVVGASFDGSQTIFSAATYAGGLDLLTRNFIPPQLLINLADGSIAPVRAAVTNGYYGLFFTDTLNVTPALSVTASGRFNSAQIGIKDEIGTSLTGVHVYNRFNPAVGFAYRFSPAVTVYGGYSEANRAPTPAELTCSDPAAPCSLASFFTGDPNLKQVVARNFEFGLRGVVVPFERARLTWNLGAYRSDLSDDIAFAQSTALGAGFFQNIGDTRRQGFDFGLHLTTPRWRAFLSYSYIDATFQSGFVESSPNNPAADANGNILVRPGDHLPGVPTNLVKFGAQYELTPRWTVGAVGVAATGQYLFGDEANLTKRLPGYFRLDLNTSYQVTPRLQVFALLENALDQTYYTYGAFSPTASVPIVQAPGASNPRSYSIAAPIAAFGGLRLTF